MIEFENVSFSYGTSAAEAADAEAASASMVSASEANAGAGVAEVSLRVEAGRCVLVTGESGCGKTTLARLANGLAPSFFPGRIAGRVRVDGDDLSDMPSWEVARRVGSVFQNPRTQFFNVDSTGEVAFALESQGLPEAEVRARADATISELGLEELAGRSIFDLSGGEKQRIAYASVWAARPGNLVLDEPTSNLDVESIRELGRYLRDAKAQGAAILVAEHRLWWLMDVADEVVVMRAGRVVQRMSIGEFRALPACEVSELGLRVRDLGEVCVSSDAMPSGAVGRVPSSDAACAPAPDAACTRAGDAERTLAPGDACVRVRGLRASYGKREVLRGVDLDVAGGEVVALVGRNGAGKSTLARAILGLCKSDEGRVCLDSDVAAMADASEGALGAGSLAEAGALADVPAQAPSTRSLRGRKERAARKRRLNRGAMVFQDVNYQLFAESVRSEVTFGLSSKERADDALALGVLARLGLDGLAECHPRTLSGGQKQRLAVAACVASGRGVLAFDEPTSGLDLASCTRVAALVRELAAEGRAVLVITHDLEFIARACDRAVLLRDGLVAGEACVRGDLAEVRDLLR